MSDETVFYKPCVAYLNKWSSVLYLVEFKCFD